MSCYACAKFVLFGFNFVLWLIGCALVATGIWLRVDAVVGSFVAGSDKYIHIYTACYVLIALGGVVMVLSFLGCCGAVRESQCLLVQFFIAILLIFSCLVALGIWGFINKEKAQETATNILVDAVNSYYKNVNSKNIMDYLQTTFFCCGATQGPADYTPNEIPVTCKRAIDPCLKNLQELLEKNLKVIAGVCIGFAATLMLGIILAVVLCCGIRRNRRMMSRYK